MAEIEDNSVTDNEEENSDIHNVIIVVNPAILFEYCCGILRFSIADKKLLPPTGKMRAYSVLAICIFIIFNLLHLPLSVYPDKFNAADVMDEINYWLLLIQYTTFVVLTSFFHNEVNIKIFSMLAGLDKLLNINLNKATYISSKKRTVAYVSIMLACHIVLSVFILMIVDIPVVNLISGQMYFIQKLEILVFCKIIGMLKYRLYVINEYITKFIDITEKNKGSVFTVVRHTNEEIKDFNWIGRPSETNLKIHDLAHAYGHIGTICTLVNEVFNFQLFMTLMTTLMCLIVTIWRLLYIYLSGINNVAVILIIAVWSAASMSNVILIALNCESLLTARDTTRVLVNRLIMNYDLPKIMRNQAKAFMDLIEVLPLTISIYDMFTVDISLILKFISISTTYLIVIIQIHHYI